PPLENLVLPTFNDTFSRAPRSFPPKKGRLTKAVSVVSAYLFSAPPKEREEVGRMRDDPAERLPKSLEVMGEPVRIGAVRRVVTIGVHGWFPNSMVRSVFGEPTGTRFVLSVVKYLPSQLDLIVRFCSVKFATMMHDAVQSYLEDHDSTSFNIQAIALEGEGQVEDRVDKLFDQLIAREAWVEALRKADVVFLATHSQGSVVSAHLLARMIEKGLAAGPRTHLLAMCGIAQGPFVYLSQSYALSPYFNYIEAAPARELFEFQDPESVVAAKFLESLRFILAAGVKMTVVGSINDQVVPLYSALFSGITHPSILRAVYIDSAAFRTSDFLANLVVFACRLRNAGLRDHDLVYHVSEALAGALSGVGHSKAYEEEDIFALAVRYQFETTSLLEAPTHLDINGPPIPFEITFKPKDRRNPYLLTWALRGIIEDPQVRELFSNELSALRDAYETWRPVTKTLKEVKLKLEGIRMLPFVSLPQLSPPSSFELTNFFVPIAVQPPEGWKAMKEEIGLLHVGPKANFRRKDGKPRQGKEAPHEPQLFRPLSFTTVLRIFPHPSSCPTARPPQLALTSHRHAFLEPVQSTFISITCKPSVPISKPTPLRCPGHQHRQLELRRAGVRSVASPPAIRAHSASGILLTTRSDPRGRVHHVQSRELRRALRAADSLDASPDPTSSATNYFRSTQ
ncbi:hypothetical protein P7C70_g4482, partial [Phenoliferia sp. Uapishka_3]